MFKISLRAFLHNVTNIWMGFFRHRAYIYTSHCAFWPIAAFVTNNFIIISMFFVVFCQKDMIFVFFGSRPNIFIWASNYRTFANLGRPSRTLVAWGDRATAHFRHCINLRDLGFCSIIHFKYKNSFFYQQNIFVVIHLFA